MHLVCTGAGEPPVIVEGAADRDFGVLDSWVNGLQAELTRLYTNGRQIVLENTGHGIFLDAPNAVLEGMRTVWNRGRAALRK
jgi:hypothetical protein